MNTIGFFVLLAVGVITAKNIPVYYDVEDGPELFEAFIKKYNKQYVNKAEKAKRYGIFLKKLEEINELNENSELAEFGITKFSDLTKEEFNKKYNGVRRGSSDTPCTTTLKISHKKRHNKKGDDSFDWRSKGAVSDVKNQKECGSCWAFSAIANVESVYAIKTGQLLDLSEQQVVDCDTDSFGCDGGYPSHALNYLKQSGVMNENDYPYVAANQTCQFDASKVAVKISDCSSFTTKDEAEVANKLSGIAPLSIALDADGLSEYSKGILSGNNCQGSAINHAVLLVGYGEENNTPYWIVKNSWGADWGENGYFRMQKGVNCLIFTSFEMVTAVID